MVLLALLLAASDGGVSPRKNLVEEIRFESARYCLPFSGSRKFQIDARDPKLISLATEDAAAGGRTIVFQTAIARNNDGHAFYAFRIQQYFDIYLVYETDSKRQRWIRKFRYSGKAHKCALPWPSEH